MSLFNSLAGGVGNAGIISVYAASVVCVGSLLVQTNPLTYLGHFSHLCSSRLCLAFRGCVCITATLWAHMGIGACCLWVRAMTLIEPSACISASWTWSNHLDMFLWMTTSNARLLDVEDMKVTHQVKWRAVWCGDHTLWVLLLCAQRQRASPQLFDPMQKPNYHVSQWL